MRIDFTRLENYVISPNIVSAVISNNIPKTQRQSYDKKYQDAIIEVQQQKSPTLSFSINYPFEINRSVSQTSMKKQLAYIGAKKQLPASALKFIQASLHSEFQKKASIKNNTKNMQQQSQKYSQKSNQLKSQEKKQLSSVGLINKNNNISQIRLYDQLKPKITKRPAESKVHNFKRKCLKEQKYRNQDKELDGVSLKPMLNYTMNSKPAKIMSQKRNHHFKTCQIDVFQSLYHDASIYTTKRQMQRVIMEQQSKSFTLKSSRVKVNSTFQERLRLSIQKQAIKKKMAQQKIDFNPQTGKKYFVPDTHKSKRPYCKSRKISIAEAEDSIYPARAAHYSKDSQKLNRSQQMTSTINNSYEKDLNKSLDGKYKIIRKPLQKQNKLANLYAELLWSEQYLKEQQLTVQEKKVLLKLLQDFQKYQQKYSKNINKQVFIAIFKDYYAGLNLFDRAILDERLKRIKQAQKLEISRLNTKRNQEQFLTGRKKSYSNINFYHTQRQYFI